MTGRANRRAGRTYKGRHEWSVQEKRMVCAGLVAIWDGTLRGLNTRPVVTFLRSVATVFKVREKEQLRRQLEAAIVRKRKEPWAKQWQSVWRTALKGISRQVPLTGTGLEQQVAALGRRVDQLERDTSPHARAGYLL